RTDFREVSSGLFRRQGMDAFMLGRNIQHTDACAVAGRRELDAFFRWLTGSVIDWSRCAARVPYFMKEWTVRAADALHARYGAILLDDGFAIGIMARNNPPDGCFLHPLAGILSSSAWILARFASLSASGSYCWIALSVNSRPLDWNISFA